MHNLNDLAAEAVTLEHCRSGEIDVLHFLDGEHSGPYIPKYFRSSPSCHRNVATFHQPPALAEQVVHGPSLRLLDAIVLMSSAQVPFFATFAPPERIHVIPHGVHVSSLDRSRSPFRPSLVDNP